jgi:hypothetical protein
MKVYAKRTVIARFGGMRYEVHTAEPVTAHFQNLGVLQNGYKDVFCPPNATIYARSINEEAQLHTNFKVNGGTMWVLGFKTEADHTAFHAANNGMLEVLGGYVNFAGPHDEVNPDIINEESNVTYIGTNHFFRGDFHPEGIWEIRDGVTHKLPNDGRFPRRIAVESHQGNYFVPLYVGYDPGMVRTVRPTDCALRPAAAPVPSFRSLPQGLKIRAGAGSRGIAVVHDMRGRRIGRYVIDATGRVLALSSGCYVVRTLDVSRLQSYTANVVQVNRTGGRTGSPDGKSMP